MSAEFFCSMLKHKFHLITFECATCKLQTACYTHPRLKTKRRVLPFWSLFSSSASSESIGNSALTRPEVITMSPFACSLLSPTILPLEKYLVVLLKTSLQHKSPRSAHLLFSELKKEHFTSAANIVLISLIVFIPVKKGTCRYIAYVRIHTYIHTYIHISLTPAHYLLLIVDFSSSHCINFTRSRV